MKYIHKLVFKSIDVSIVAIFRIFFGMFMTYQMIYYYEIDYTFQFIFGPEVLFPYQGLEFLQPFSLGFLKVIHAGLLISAILITLGFLYRYAMIFFFVGFSYFSFIDKTLYNNHIYLIALIAFVMIFMNADRKYSLRVKFSKKPLSKLVPAWQQNILIFLLSVVYFYGGISKLSPNWLDSNLVGYTIDQAQSSVLTNLFPKETLIMLIKYGGLIFDLSIAFILLNKRTRLFGVILVVIFSYTNNSILFDDIGIFPFFMICATILFFDSKKVGNYVDGIFMSKSTENSEEQEAVLDQNESPKFKKLTLICIFLFVAFQLVFPLRHHFLTTNPEWTGIAQKFSWRMKMQSRNVTQFTMSLVDRATSQRYNLDGTTFVTRNQFMHMPEDPYTFVHLAKYISKKLYLEQGLVNPIIKADLQVEFNGMPTQHMLDPRIDLTKMDEDQFSDNQWISEFKGYQ
ncbi:HTTM domain-containing protein [uncultured Kordia sp.]|uniref:HTTM domain-containing protein n=1 Tax=uncultured Kordia sp. TaxID=507699 RepID=UPI00261E369A|nr:HTTM domain-containing protein [uncultured Kordia sp.]